MLETKKVRKCIQEIGYDQKGFSYKTADIDVFLHKQCFVKLLHHYV